MTASTASQARRLATPHHKGEHTSLNISSPRLRSLLLLPSDEGDTLSFVRIISSFKLLRVLDLKDAIIENLPNEIGALIHLRYLGFYLPSSGLPLPPSLGNLYNLQTLNIAFDNTGCPVRLPETIGRMQQLRHLLVESVDRIFIRKYCGNALGRIGGYPCLDQLSNLQTLVSIEADSWIRNCLAKLTNLKKLGIRLDEFFEESCKFILELGSLHSLFVRATSIQNFRWVPLAHLINLRELHLADVIVDRLPHFSKFPKNLTKLTLVGNFLREDPLMTLGQLESLQILKLRLSSYLGESMLCSRQGFPQLKTLYIDHLQRLNKWKIDMGSMPSLLHLCIDGCRSLKTLPEGLEHVTTLKTLDLRRLLLIEEERHRIENIPVVNIWRTEWLEDRSP